MKNLILFHNHCTDGMMAATLLYLHFMETGELENSEFIAVNYNEPIPDVTDKHVYIVDFSYHPDIINEASKIAKSIVMLDHHLKAAQEWGSYHYRICPPLYADNDKNKLLVCGVYIAIAEHKSGAGLVYEYLMKVNSDITNTEKFSSRNRLKRVTHSVQDRDLWKFELNQTKEIHEALNILPRIFEAWKNFLIDITDEEFDEKLKAAHYYLEVKEKLAQEYASKFQMTTLLGYDIPIVNCPANFASRVGEILSQDHPFSLTYCLSNIIVYCSLRSNKEKGIDVNEIAKVFEGGGHRNSSGFKMNTSIIYFLLSGYLTKSVYDFDKLSWAQIAVKL